jgi:hypothetical protein
MPFSGFSTGELIPALVRQGLQALIEAELQQPSVRTATSARRSAVATATAAVGGESVIQRFLSCPIESIYSRYGRETHVTGSKSPGIQVLLNQGSSGPYRRSSTL